MKRRRFIFNTVATGTGICLSPLSCKGYKKNTSTGIDVPENWALLWNDEFNSGSIDPLKWNPSTNMPWLAENVFLSDGVLNLRASMSSMENNQRFGGVIGLSGDNFMKVEPPARIEFRFKPVMKPGTFIALWAMTNNHPSLYSFEQNTWNTKTFSDYNMAVRKEFDFLECAGGENTFENNSMQIKAHMTAHSWINPTPDDPKNQSTAQFHISPFVDVGNPVKWQEMRIDWDDDNMPGGKELRYYWRESGKAWDKPIFILRPESSFFPENHAMNKIAFDDFKRVDILDKIWNEPIRIILFNLARDSRSWLSQERLAQDGRNTWGGELPDIGDFPVDMPVDYIRIFVPEGDRRL